MLKKILLAALVLFPMLASAQSIKIGVVDTQKLMTDLPAYKEAMTKIEGVAKKYDTEHANLRAEAQKKLEEFQTLAQDASTPDAVKERRAKELDEFSQKLSEFEQMAQQDLQKQQQAETAARQQNKTEKHQNIADKASAKMERNEALSENADTPKKKNK